MAHEKVYGISENKCRKEVYPKTETYSKNETYSKDETYSKGEVDAKSGNSILPIGTIIMSVDYSHPAYGEWSYLGVLSITSEGTQGTTTEAYCYQRTA